MILTQTKALLLDAYRDLNSRKLFWAVLMLNVLVIALFASLGVQGNYLRIFNWNLPFKIPMVAMFFYKWIFTYVIIEGWLTWGATILALISTASIFPEFLAGGTIDLYLSKPISRLRLFLTKYCTGLLFVAIQVAVASAGGFLVLGLRAGAWEPGIFLAIPVVVLFFSYLFAISVLLGVFTRSTLAAFFLTLIAWAFIAGVNRADTMLAQADDYYRDRAAAAQKNVARLDREIAELKSRVDASTRPATAPAGDLRRLQADRARQQQFARQEQPPEWFHTAQPIVFAIDSVLPKTSGTLALLSNSLFSDAVIKNVMETLPERGPMHGWRERMYTLLHARSLAWVLGSSIAFEAALLTLAARRFCRRDF